MSRSGPCEFEGGPTTPSAELAALRETPGFWANRAFHDDLLGNRVLLHEELLGSVQELRAALQEEVPD
jgi:hypothetical protein